MPIPDFNSDTFVAFTDISGFKVMMGDDDLAIKAIDHFYSIGYKCLQQNHAVHGLFLSDCGVLFSHGNHQQTGGGIEPLLRVIETMNRRLLHHDIILTTSIAYGRFSYHQRLEFPGIEKNPIYGHAYVAAYLDNETGKPKLQPGECRIVKRGLPNGSLYCEPRISVRRGCAYFHWMVNDQAEIEDFQRRYSDAYQLKYRGMLEALKWKGQQVHAGDG